MITVKCDTCGKFFDTKIIPKKAIIAHNFCGEKCWLMYALIETTKN